MSDDVEKPSEHHDAEPKPNPSAFYMDQAKELEDHPEFQRLVRERATELLGAEKWGSDPDDLKQGMQECVRYLKRSLDDPHSPSGLPTLIDLAEDRPEDQEIGEELVALLQGDPENFEEAIPQAGPMILGARGNSYVESRLPIALPGWQLVRSRYIEQISGKNAARYKYYLEPAVPTA